MQIANRRVGGALANGRPGAGGQRVRGSPHAGQGSRQFGPQLVADPDGVTQPGATTGRIVEVPLRFLPHPKGRLDLGMRQGEPLMGRDPVSDPFGRGSFEVMIPGETPKTIRPKLGRWFDRRRGPQNPLLVPLRLGPLLPLQESPDDDGKGGLWMALEGARTISLISSGVRLPNDVSEDAVPSLNHAYTRLSEHFETQRISHTGNVYEQVLYQEPNGLWYPLKVFRDEKIADEENQIARAFWDDLKASLSAPAKKG